MTSAQAAPSARQTELLEAAYRYVLEHGLADLSLRPLAAAIGSSPRVLLYLFGSKDGLVRALLNRARAEEVALLARLDPGSGLEQAGSQLWGWMSAPGHRSLVALWVEGYGRSLIDPDGPWAGFAEAGVRDWLEVLATAQPAGLRDTPDGERQRTAVLALLRGAVLDLLATGDLERTTATVTRTLRWIAPAPD